MEASGQPHAPAAVPPGKELSYALNGRLGGPQSRCERYGGDKSLLPVAGFNPRTVQCVA